jgi:hypothetical protein
MDDIATRVETFPQAWKPKVGDKLVGVVDSVEEIDGEYGAYPLLVIHDETRDVDLAFHAFHTVAKAELARKRPVIGDRIAIKYFGRDEEKGYERYRILIERTEQPIDWDKHAEAAEVELGGDDGESLPLGPGA